MSTLSQVVVHAMSPPATSETAATAVPVSTQDADDCRCAYVDAMRQHTVSGIYTFLHEQAQLVTRALEERTDIAWDPHPARTLQFEVLDEDMPERIKHVNVNDGHGRMTFVTVGRLDHNDVCTTHLDTLEWSHSEVSRTHALLVLAPFASGMELLVIDLWSRYGTSVRDTSLISSSDARRILRVPVALDESCVLELGGLHATSTSPPLPLRVTVQTLHPRHAGGAAPPTAADPRLPQCLVCMEAPRTEVFEGCRHLVGCAACVRRLLCGPAPVCPVCRAPVSFGETRAVRVEEGEVHTHV